jgi:fido (protein-threonine AMPylation protein)
VVEALIADGWTITADPLTISFGGRNLFVDLAAERAALAAERDGRRIAVEVKSFLDSSSVHDLEQAVGQFTIYRMILAQSATESDRQVYLAVHRGVFEGIFSEPIGQFVVTQVAIPLLVFDVLPGRVIRWIE